MPEPSRRAFAVLACPLLEITVHAPPQEASPNKARSCHWRDRYKAIGAYRQACKAIVRAQCPKPFPAEKVRVSYHWLVGRKRIVPSQFPFEREGKKTETVEYRPYRPADEANGLSALKSLDDAMVDAGIAPDDDRAHWEFGGITFGDGEDKVVVTVEVLA